ncbi:MAG: hypothetical protein K2O89_04335 [Clostridia bacterium]|nr:hypothetical protein [Clostridia bacterium]
MKKILALTLTGLLVLGGTGMAVSATATSIDPHPLKAETMTTSQNSLYLVPGTYVSGGQKVENTISSGATKLTDDECAEIFTENAYLCTLAKGATLPVPSSSREDKDGNAFIFNGWWTIVDATVTYYDKVPNLSGTTYLYADWRAEVSQPKDPIIPDDFVEIEPVHYMSIARASGETDIVTLRKTSTDMDNAETLGYNYPVELYSLGFELNPGDVITVYTTGLEDSEKAVISPVLDSNKNRNIQLESSGDGSNVTADYLEAASLDNWRTKPTMTCIADEVGYYNVYIKYYAGGSIMAVYMEPSA